MSNALNASAARPPAANPTTNARLAWSALVEPSQAFAALRERPRFWFPLLAAALAYAVFFAWYYSRVDIAWLADHILGGDPRLRQMSDEERAAAAQGLSKGFLLGSSLLTVLVAVPLLRVLEALYFFLVGRAAAIEISFRHWMALSCWSAWPQVLAVVVMTVPLLLKANGQVAPDALNLLSLNELFFHVPLSSPWHTFVSTVTLLHAWSWWLSVLAVRRWTGRSWAFSAVFALVPVLAVYGGWALFILL